MGGIAGPGWVDEEAHCLINYLLTKGLSYGSLWNRQGILIGEIILHAV